MNPFSLVTGTVSGVGSMFDKVSAGLNDPYDESDNAVDGLLGTSAALRQLAYQYDVDPYTKFPPLAKRLALDEKLAPNRRHRLHNQHLPNAPAQMREPEPLPSRGSKLHADQPRTGSKLHADSHTGLRPFSQASGGTGLDEVLFDDHRSAQGKNDLGEDGHTDRRDYPRLGEWREMACSHLKK